MASFEPVEAPDGTAARPDTPDSSTTSASMVGLPRESRISRAMTSTMALMLLTLQAGLFSFVGGVRHQIGFGEPVPLARAIDLDQRFEQRFHARKRPRVGSIGQRPFRRGMCFHEHAR